jgi:4-amino-4-deoxy-L-arabinose transferase-like glycosyltransferase
MTTREESSSRSAVAYLAALALVLGLGSVLLVGQSDHGFGPVGSLLALALWLAVWTAASLGAGRSVVGWCRAGSPETGDDLVLALATGSGVLVAASVVLSVTGWFRPWPLVAVLALAAVRGTVDLGRRPIPVPRLGWWAAVLAIPWLVALVIAATVTTFYDQWHQHLGFPWIWLRDGFIHVLPRNFYSWMPVNSSLMYAYGIGTLGAWSAQVIHWWCGVVTVVSCGLLGRRLAGRGAGWWAATIFATTPTALHIAASGGSDLVVTVFAGAGWLALLRTADDDETHPLRWWLLAGALAGLAAGTKYTGLGTVVLPLAAGAVLLHRPWRVGERPVFLRGAGIATFGGLVTFGPWVARNLATAGAPFFPFLIGPFRVLLRVDPEAVDRFGGWISGFDLDPAHIVAGLDLGTWTPPIGEFAPAGLLWLGVAGATVFSFRRFRGPVAAGLTAGALIGVAFWLTGLQVVRYLLPALVPSAALLGAGLHHALAGAALSIRRAGVVLVVAAISWNLSTTLHPVGFQRLGCSLGLEPVEPLLARWVSSSLAFDAVDRLPADAKILLVAESRAFGFERDVVLEHPFGESRLEELARIHDSPEEMAAVLVSDGITHVLTNRWEARRIAGMRRRPRYFVHGDQAAMTRVDEFARACLDPEWLGHGVSLYRLDPSCTSNGADDLATW